MKISVKVGHLQAMLLTAGKTDIRFYLNTVQFEVQNGTLFMVSTDGHRLTYMRQPAPGQPDAVRLIKRDGLTTVLKGLKAHDVIELDLDFMTATLPTGAVLSGMLATEEGKFPDWRRVIPNCAPHEHAAHINPAYLADLAKAATYISQAEQRSRDNAMPVRSWVTDTQGSIIATLLGFAKFGYVCMAATLSKAQKEQGLTYNNPPSTKAGEEDPTEGLA